MIDNSIHIPRRFVDKDNNVFFYDNIGRGIIYERVKEVQPGKTLVLDFSYNLGDGLTTSAKKFSTEVRNSFSSYDQITLSNNEDEFEFFQLQSDFYWFSVFLRNFQTKKLIGTVLLSLILVLIELLFETQNTLFLLLGGIGFFITLSLVEVYRLLSGRWKIDFIRYLNDSSPSSDRAFRQISKALSNLGAPRVVIVDDIERFSETSKNVLRYYFSDPKNFERRNTTSNIWIFLNTNYGDLGERIALKKNISNVDSKFIEYLEFTVPLLTLEEKIILVRHHGLPKEMRNRRILKSIMETGHVQWMKNFLNDTQNNKDLGLNRDRLKFIYFLAYASDPTTTCFTPKSIKDKVFNRKAVRYLLLEKIFDEGFISNRDVTKKLEFISKRLPQIIESEKVSSQTNFIGIYKEVGEALDELQSELSLPKPYLLHCYWLFFFGDLIQNEKSINYLNASRIVTHLNKIDTEFLFREGHSDQFKLRVEELISLCLQVFVDFAMIVKYRSFVESLFQVEDLQLSNRIINEINKTNILFELYSGSSFPRVQTLVKDGAVGFRYKIGPIANFLKAINDFNLYLLMKKYMGMGFKLENSSDNLARKIKNYLSSLDFVSSKDLDSELLKKLFQAHVNSLSDEEITENITFCKELMNKKKSLIISTLIFQVFVINAMNFLVTSRENKALQDLIIQVAGQLSGRKLDKSDFREIKSALFQIYKWNLSLIIDTSLDALKIIFLNVGFNKFNAPGEPSISSYFSDLLANMPLKEVSNEFSRNTLGARISFEAHEIHYSFMSKIITHEVNEEIEDKPKEELFLILNFLGIEIKDDTELLNHLIDFQNNYSLKSLLPPGYLNLAFLLKNIAIRSQDKHEEILKFLNNVGDESISEAYSSSMQIFADIESYNNEVLKSEDLIQKWEGHLLYGSIVSTLSDNSDIDDKYLDNYLLESDYIMRSEVYLLIDHCHGSVKQEIPLSNKILKKLEIVLSHWKSEIAVKYVNDGFFVLFATYNDKFQKEFRYWQGKYHEAIYLKRVKFLSESDGFFRIIGLYCQDFLHIGVKLSIPPGKYYELIKMDEEDKRYFVEHLYNIGLAEQLINKNEEIDAGILVAGEILFSPNFISNAKYDKMRDHILSICRKYFNDFFDLLISIDGLSSEMKEILMRYRAPMKDVDVVN